VKFGFQLKPVCAATLLLAAAPAVFAQAPYPTQQIKIICPFPAGGGTDLTSRLLGEQLAKSLGQPLVEQREGSKMGSVEFPKNLFSWRIVNRFPGPATK